MPQILRPAATIKSLYYTGDHESINQHEREDSTYAYAEARRQAELVVLLAPPVDVPGPGDCHIRWVHGRVNNSGQLQSGGNNFTYTCSLLCCDALIASSSVTPQGWQESTLTFQAFDVSDWTSLALHFKQTSSGGRPATWRAGAVSWAQLVTPAPLAPTPRHRRIIHVP
jgi:hypothetical protein